MLFWLYNQLDRRRRTHRNPWLLVFYTDVHKTHKENSEEGALLPSSSYLASQHHLAPVLFRLLHCSTSHSLEIQNLTCFSTFLERPTPDLHLEIWFSVYTGKLGFFKELCTWHRPTCLSQLGHLEASHNKCTSIKALVTKPEGMCLFIFSWTKDLPKPLMLGLPKGRVP